LLQHAWRERRCLRAFDDPNDCAPSNTVMILADYLNGAPIDFLWPAVRRSEHAHHPLDVGSDRHIVCAVSFLTLGKTAGKDANLELRLLRQTGNRSEGEYS
jgi:hypothetical protein